MERNIRARWTTHGALRGFNPDHLGKVPYLVPEIGDVIDGPLPQILVRSQVTEVVFLSDSAEEFVCRCSFDVGW